MSNLLPGRPVAATQRLRHHVSIPLYANAYFLMISSALAQLSGLIFWALAARLYNPADVGVASALISATNLLGLISGLGLGIGIVRFLSSAGDRAESVINTCLTVKAVLALLASILFLMGLRVWSPALLFMSERPTFAVLFVVISAVSSMHSWTKALFIAERSARFNVIQDLLLGLSTVFLVVALAQFFGAFGIFLAIGLSTTVVLAATLLWLEPRVRPGYLPRVTVQLEVLRLMIPYSLANYLALLVGNLTHTILPLLTINVLGAEATAYYYLAASVSGVLLMIAQAVSNSLFAEGARDRTGLRANVVRGLALALFLTGGGLLLIILFADRILLLFGASYAQNGAGLLRLLALSSVPTLIISLYLTITRVTDKVRRVITVTAGMAGSTLLFSYILMVKFGLLGVGLGQLLGVTLTALAICPDLLGAIRKAGWQHASA